MTKARKKWIIYPKFQLTLVLINLALFLVFFGYFFYQILSSFLYMEQIGTKADLAKDHPYFTYLNFQRDLLTQELLISSGIFIFISVVFTVILSHKISGPMHRLQHFLEDYCQFRSKSKLYFRKSDFFQEIPDLLNQAIELAEKKEKKKD